MAEEPKDFIVESRRRMDVKLDRIESRLDRIERRLDLVELPH